MENHLFIPQTAAQEKYKPRYFLNDKRENPEGISLPDFYETQNVSMIYARDFSFLPPKPKAP